MSSQALNSPLPKPTHRPWGGSPAKWEEDLDPSRKLTACQMPGESSPPGPAGAQLCLLDREAIKEQALCVRDLLPGRQETTDPGQEDPETGRNSLVHSGQLPRQAPRRSPRSELRAQQHSARRATSRRARHRTALTRQREAVRTGRWQDRKPRRARQPGARPRQTLCSLARSQSDVPEPPVLAGHLESPAQPPKAHRDRLAHTRGLQPPPCAARTSHPPRLPAESPLANGKGFPASVQGHRKGPNSSGCLTYEEGFIRL